MNKKHLLPLLSAGIAVLCAAFLLYRPAPVLLDNDPSGEGDDYEIIADETAPLAGEPGAEADPYAGMDAAAAAAVKTVLDQVNAARAQAGVGPLTLDAALCTGAAVRAAECVKTFSHTRPDGTPYKTAIAEAGVSASYTGENVATGYADPAKVMAGWMNSEGHKANILSPKFTRIGIGLAANTGSKYSGYSWSQLFTNG